MTPQEGELRDSRGNLVLEFTVERANDFFSGRIVKVHAQCSLFLRYERAVNDISLAVEDELQDQVDALGLVAVFGANPVSQVPLTDVQVYPSQGDLSFRLSRTDSE